MRIQRLLFFLALALVSAGCRGAAGARVQAAELWAFTGPWDTLSHRSVREHGGELDVIVTGWIGLDSVTGQPLLPSPFPDTVRPRTGTPRRMAIVTSWHGTGFHARSIRRLGRDSRQLARAAGAIAAHASQQGYRGLVIDFETLIPADLDLQLRVVRVIRDSARARGVGPITVAIPAADSAYPVRELLEVADFVLVMLYDQHWAGSDPGPVSAPDWVDRALAARVAEAGAERVIAGLPTYGYRWVPGRTGESVGFAEATRHAQVEGLPLERDAASGTLRAKRDGRSDTWVTDAILLRQLMTLAERRGVRRFAFWRLGQEDPALWQEPVFSGRRAREE